MTINKPKRTIAFILILCAASSLAAQKAYVYEVTGKPIIESATGIPGKAVKGSGLAYDEYLITQAASSASLVLDGTVIKIGNDSALGFVFSGTGTDPHPALVPASGAVSFSFPGTASTQVAVIVCGAKVRCDRRDPAAFTVHTAINGSAVVSVTQGFVEMETEQDTVWVSAGEMAELTFEANAAGMGTANVLHRDESVFDFKSWNDQKTKQFLDDPLTVFAKAGLPAVTHCALYAQLNEPYSKATDAWRKAAVEYREALAIGDANTIAEVRTNTLFPAQDARLRILNEMHYHAQMALIIRRFTLDRLFAQFNKTSPVYAQDTATVLAFFAMINTLNGLIDTAAATEP